MRLLLPALLATACGSSTPGATQRPTPTPERVTPPAPSVQRLPRRCDDDAVDGLRSQMLGPGASPRVAVAFAPAAGDSRFAIVRSYADNQRSTDAAVAIDGEQMTIEAGDSAVMLALAGGALTMTDGRRPSKHDDAFRLARDLFGLVDRQPLELLPAMPIGRGGRWRIVTRDEYGFLASDYEAASIGPGAITVRVERLECRKMKPPPASPSAGPPECMEGPPPGGDPLRCFEGLEWSQRLERGELTFALDRALPTGELSVSEEWVFVDYGKRTPGSREWRLTISPRAR